MAHLVIDVGTSSVRAAAVWPDATLTAEHRVAFLPDTPSPGAVEFDAALLARHVLDLATRVLSEVGSVDGVGITNQRASAIVWDRATGQPIGPGIGWQDLRTAGTCLMLRAQNINVAPNASATKVAYLLDLFDPHRDRDLCFGTVDSWVAWTLSDGRLHVTDATNAAVTGLTRLTDQGAVVWDAVVLEALKIPESMLPAIVDSTGVVGEATALRGAPPIAGIAGDQQASLLGQACVLPGATKITFGTGGMLDICVGPDRPNIVGRGTAGTFPIVAWQSDGRITWGGEAIMLSAGTAVEWLRDDLGILASAAESEAIAGQCETTDDVWFVPALLGLGTPDWDYGARGTLLGMTRGTGRPQIVRAVLEGIAHRGADLVEAAEADTGLAIGALRVDGGMSANRVFLQALADATQRRVEVSPVAEATALGAGFLAGLATGTWPSLESLDELWEPSRVVEPRSVGPAPRERWREVRSRSQGWIPALSAIEF